MLFLKIYFNLISSDFMIKVKEKRFILLLFMLLLGSGTFGPFIISKIISSQIRTLRKIFLKCDYYDNIENSYSEKPIQEIRDMIHIVAYPIPIWYRPLTEDDYVKLYELYERFHNALIEETINALANSEDGSTFQYYTKKLLRNRKRWISIFKEVAS